LLDSAEAVACGLVQCLASKKRMWNSFGLDVHLNMDSENASSVPTYDVRDSEQVIPFFKQGAHNLLEDDDNDNSQNFEESDDEHDRELHVIGRKRSKFPNRRNLLPASARLGSILVIVRIDAEPSSLPLPTLSKVRNVFNFEFSYSLFDDFLKKNCGACYSQGRLPIGIKAIDDALEVGVTQCLQQLQKTNPSLLLTASELRRAECDARCVPAASLALASILSKSTLIESRQFINRIQGWNGRSGSMPSDIVTCSSSDELDASNESCNVKKGDDVQALGLMIERQFRSVLACPLKSIVATKENCLVDYEDESDTINCSAAPMEGTDLVPRKKVKKKSNSSQLVHAEPPDYEATGHIEYEAYRDFDEWF
jgi:hypothetical protein